MSHADQSPPNGISDGRILRNGAVNSHTPLMKNYKNDDNVILCCGSSMSKNNAYLIGEQLSPEASEIGRVPGQKWPHAIGKQKSFNHHLPLKVCFHSIPSNTLI